MGKKTRQSEEGVKNYNFQTLIGVIVITLIAPHNYPDRF
jgi:hypothetical protein